MSKKLIIKNGVDINPNWTNRIAISYDLSGSGVINPTSTLAAGGSLVNGQAYYYKVVAVMQRHINLAGDSLSQLSGLTVNAPNGGKWFWGLYNSGTTRTFSISTDAYGQYVVATGSRTGDGLITISEKNGSGINGSVTVAFSANVSGSAQYFEIKGSELVGYEETTKTATAANMTINLAWTAQIDVLEGYRIYRGTTAGVYDGFFNSATNSFVDDGTKELDCDETFAIDEIINVSGRFIAAANVNGRQLESQSSLMIHMVDSDDNRTINLKDVTSPAGWNLGTNASTQVAEAEFNSWI